MDSLVRLWPYVWAFKKQFCLSILFAVLVAAFWGANLSAAFPVVKVLLQGQSLAEYIDGQIQQTEKSILNSESALQEIARDTGEPVNILKERARTQEHLSSSSSKLLVLNWVKTYIISWLPEDQFDMLALILAAVLAGTLLKGVFLFCQDILIKSVVERTVMKVRTEAFSKVLELDYQTLSNKGTGELMSRFTNDLTELSNGLNLMGGKLIREPLKAGVCIFLAFWVNWQLTLLSFLFVPLAGIVFYRIGKKLKQASHRQMESMSRIYKTLEETFDGLKVVIAFNGKKKHEDRFIDENGEYYQKAMKIARIDSLMSPATELLGILAAFMALLPGAYLVLRGKTAIWGVTLSSSPMDIAQLSVLYVLLIGTLDPVRKLSSVYTKLKRSSAAADRIFNLLDEVSLVKDVEDPKPLKRLQKQIQFQNIQFGYAIASTDQDGKRPSALNDVSLTIPSGEVVALVGENGSGKSTLINLLPRFFDPIKGQVLVDDLDIRDAKLTDLRDQIGLVSQETLLFDDTIAENIRYGCPKATRKQIEEAGKQAHVDQFVDQLPEHYDTRVGEKGQKLSGGQRQRISLARAILRDPSILILDEATSAIDTQSEYLIHQALKTFVSGRTTFIITHTMTQSMLDIVTKIVVMDKGRVSMVGTHETLMEQCPIYQRLFSNQVQKRSA